jgi:hypothetical protein
MTSIKLVFVVLLRFLVGDSELVRIDLSGPLMMVCLKEWR